MRIVFLIFLVLLEWITVLKLLDELQLFCFLNRALDHLVGDRLESDRQVQGPPGFPHDLSYVLECLDLILIVFVDLLTLFHCLDQLLMLVDQSHDLLVDVEDLLLKMINFFLLLYFDLFYFAQRVIDSIIIQTVKVIRLLLQRLTQKVSYLGCILLLLQQLVLCLLDEELLLKVFQFVNTKLILYQERLLE